MVVIYLPLACRSSTSTTDEHVDKVKEIVLKIHVYRLRN